MRRGAYKSQSNMHKLRPYHPEVIVRTILLIVRSASIDCSASTDSIWYIMIYIYICLQYFVGRGPLPRGPLPLPRGPLPLPRGPLPLPLPRGPLYIPYIHMTTPDQRGSHNQQWQMMWQTTLDLTSQVRCLMKNVQTERLCKTERVKNNRSMEIIYLLYIYLIY